MLKSSLRFLGFKGHTKTPKPNLSNHRESKGKLRKVRHPNTSVDIPARSSTPMEKEVGVDTSAVRSEGRDSREYYQDQPEGILFSSQETAVGQPNIHNIEATHVSSPHIQADRDEISHLFSSISGNPSRDFSEGGKKPGVRAQVSVDPTVLWSPRPSVRRNSFGGRGDSFTPGSDDDRGGVQDWVNSTSGLSGPDYIPKPYKALELTPFNVDPHEHNSQERHDTENDKPSQQQNNKPDHGGVQDWVNSTSGLSGPDYIPKPYKALELTPFNVDQHEHNSQERHDTANDKASQQQNHEPYRPMVSPPEEGGNCASRETDTKGGHNHEGSKAAVASGHGDRAKDSFEPEIYYYIVPAGLDIIFQDEEGTEITRVGKTIKGTQDHFSRIHTKNIPIVVQDISGNELFRSWTLEAQTPQRHINHDQDDPNFGKVDTMAGDDFAEQLPSPNRTPWKTIIVDEKGNQNTLKYAEGKGGST